MTSPTDPLPSAPAIDRVPLRLRLNEAIGVGAFDGCWWPQSRDLSLELADLVDNFPVALGEIRRVLVSRADWDTAPHRVRVARGLLKVGSSPGDANHQVWLRTSRRRVMRLSVMAPEDSVRPRSAPRAIGGHDDEDGEQGGSYWTDDGESWWHPHAVAPSERSQAPGY
jgi:hypothetical protein